MAIDTSPKKIRKDTRGLPEDMDPRNFYEYRYTSNLKTATGLESLILKLIPLSIHKSVVFAIDPLRDFKVAPHRITPSNRNRIRAVESVLLKRTQHRVFRSLVLQQKPNFANIQVCWSPGLDQRSEAFAEATDELTTQPVLISEINDTTRRTRLLGSLQGTMDSFQGYVNSPPRTVRRVYRSHYVYHATEPLGASCAMAGGTANARAEGQESHVSDIGPTGAVLSSSVYNNLRTGEKAYLEAEIANRVLSMFKDWSPNRRDYTLFRNLVELKDLPRGIMSIQNTVRDFRALFATLGSKPKLRDSIFNLEKLSSNVPKEYVSYHFGWKLLVKDVKDLLALPEKLSKKYAFLIRRAGKPTNFRTKRNFSSALTVGVSGFDYDGSPYEYSPLTASRLERETEIRMVINATFDFPPPDAITFKSYRFWDEIGAVPRPTDLYNLIPWSWLVDWCTGLGNYVEVIDNINRDPSLINWGMITGLTKGRLITDFQSKVDATDFYSEDFVGTHTVVTTEVKNHTSILNYECRIRKDMAAALDVNTIAAPNLNGYQQSILGAILAQRLPTFTPRYVRI